MVGIGGVGLESAGGAVLGDRLIQLALPVQGQAEVVVGDGEVGLETNGLAEFGGRRAVILLDVIRMLPRVLWALAKSGWMRMAVRCSAIASSSFPCRPRSSQRLSWKVA